MISLRLVATGIRSTRVVYNDATKSRAGQAWAFKLPLAAMRRLAYINDPHASNSFVYRSSNDHILKVAKGVHSTPLLSEETEEINPKLGQNMEKYILDLMPVSIW